MPILGESSLFPPEIGTHLHYIRETCAFAMPYYCTITKTYFISTIMAKDKTSPVAGPPKIEAVPLAISESRVRLQQHMSVLQGFGYSDLGTLGNLTIGLQGRPQTAILQRSGVLLPSSTGPFQPQQEKFSGIARKNTATGAFENFTGNVWVTASKTLTNVGGSNGSTATNGSINGKMAQDVPLGFAFWFGSEIILQDDTTVILSAEVKSLVIIAEKLTIGKRVTISWERPTGGTGPSIPLKPNPPQGYPQAISTAPERGRNGINGIMGGPGLNGQPAPEVELWFLQATGFPAIDLRGQDGFQGGRGGDGGNGGSGQKGHDSAKTKWGTCERKDDHGGDGGDGGRSGDGGKGGNGGTGGRFTVYAPQHMINAWFQGGMTISVDGGSAGSGGDPGRPGDGGPGGDPGKALHPLVCGNNKSPAGAKGNTGSSGVRGADGIKGNLISNSIQYSPITSSDFYVEVAKPAIVSVYPATAFVGDTVSINGLRFANGDKVLAKGYDGQINVPCVTTFVSNSLLTIKVPNIPGGFSLLQVVQVDGTLSTSKGTLLVKPLIAEIFPAGRIKPGQEYFIRGSGLGRTGDVWINNEYIAPFTAIDNTTVKFRAKRPSNVVENITGENAKLKVVNAEGVGQGNPNHSAEVNIVIDTYRMLVFGDSVVWGGGLFEYQKSYSLAADYLSAKLGNTKVYKTVKAHHGAKIGRGEIVTKPEMPGEMSSRWPTILQQVDSLANIPDGEEIDMVILGGGANDLPITDVLILSDAQNLQAEKQSLIAKTNQYCYHDMIFLLQKVMTRFPRAKVLVTGYYHILSEASDQSKIQQFLLSVIENIANFPSLMSNPEQTRAKIITLSNLWVAESNNNLAAAVQYLNDNSTEQPRIYFVNPGTTAANAAHAPNSLLWEPSGIAEPSDPMWKGGRQQQRDAHESRLKDEKGTLGSGWYMTKANSSFHPNPQGAQLYFDKMKPYLEKEAKTRTVAIRCNSGRYLTAVDGGGSSLVGAAVSLGAFETFDIVDLGGGQVALKTRKGHYLSAVNGGGSTVSANKLRIGSSETFTLIQQQGQKCTFKTANGKYLTTPANGILGATASAITPAEVFVIV
jgi:hypothetical protein